MASSAEVSSVRPAAHENFSFERVIAPTSKATFFEKYYEQAGLVVERSDPDYYAPCLTLDRIDEFLTTTRPNTSQVVLVSAARDIKPSDYSDPQGQIDIARVYQLFSEGATIVLPQLQRRVPELGALCRSVEQEFNALFQTNIYMTPPNAQGFKTHYDTHDVFVLQVVGSKDWRAYDIPVELPLIGQKFNSNVYSFIDPVEEFRLHAGDMYYCPRGLVHDARSTDEISVHITFGLMAKTWTEVMIEAVASACVKDPSFRENLPVGFATDPNFDRGPAREKFRALLASLADHADLDAVLDDLGQAFITSTGPQLRGQLHQVGLSETITVDTKLMARQSLVYQLSDEGEQVVLRCGSTSVSMPSHVKEILSQMLSSTRPTALTDFTSDLDHDGRIVLAKRLVKYGLVTVQ
jgi:ribosomal protein L16 Arg81 hydroxylase